MEIVNPIKHGLVNDWDAVEKLWDYVFKQHMHINLDEHPLLLAEPSFAPHSQRSKMIELAFEKYDVPATFLCKDAVLSAFAAGKSTAMVVDVGGGKTTVTPVHEGFILQRGLQKSNVGGIMLDRVLEQVMFESKNQSVPPRYLYKRRAVPAPMDGVVGDGVGELDGEYRTSYTTTKLSFPNTSASYHQFMCNRVIQDLKHGACRVADTRSMFEHAMATTTTGTGLSAVSTVPTTDYDLPDGTVLEVGPERMKIAEELFSPTDLLLKQQTNTIVNGIVNDDLVKGFAFNGLPKMIAAAGERVDVDIKKELFNFIILSGGCSLMHGFQNRLSKSIDVPAAFKVKVINALQNERKYAAWTGGSILASLGTFHQMWFSRSEYEEHGASILQRKCP